MALAGGLMSAEVWHARQQPRRNAFRYRVYYLCLPLSKLGQAANALLSINRANLFSFHEKDHGRGGDPERWIRGVLRECEISEADGEVVLMTMPRLFGYGFNPVSFWFCLDASGGLRAVLSEVNNTFGDRHCYLSHREDRGPIAPDERLLAQKVLHVSPFFPVRGEYRFSFQYDEARIAVFIDYFEGGVLRLATSVAGRRRELSARSLLREFFRTPLVTFKVIGLIHYQALKLLIKGARYHPHPKPPTTEISR